MWFWTYSSCSGWVSETKNLYMNFFRKSGTCPWTQELFRISGTFSRAVEIVQELKNPLQEARFLATQEPFWWVLGTWMGTQKPFQERRDLLRKLITETRNLWRNPLFFFYKLIKLSMNTGFYIFFYTGTIFSGTQKPFLSPWIKNKWTFYKPKKLFRNPVSVTR